MAADADIFISFPGKDRKVATTLCAALESRGFTCWISARDINPGENFQVAIVRAIRKAKVMLLVFTANSNQSEEMSKELALASQQKLAVIPLRVEDVTPNDAFAYEFATRQWIDFFADWEYAIDQLAVQIAKIIQPDPALTPAGRAATAAAAAAAVASPVKEAKAAKVKAASAPAAEAKAAAAAPGVTAAPGPELAPVLNSQGDGFADAEDAPRKGMNPLVMAAAGIGVMLAVGAAVFAFSGNKGKAAAGKPPAEAAAPANPAPPPAPPPTATAQAPAPDATAAAATPTDPAAATPAATTAPGATPGTTAVRTVKKQPPKKAHAPLRASRSDLPY